MATREDTEEQAELHFTRSMSSRGRYDVSGIDDEDEEAPDEEFEATLNNLLEKTNKDKRNDTTDSKYETDELLIMKPEQYQEEKNRATNETRT